MKGKGKGKEKDKEQLDRDCPLQFPNFATIDHKRSCSIYSTILERNEDEGISIEDLDSLQFDLEDLLVSVTKRKNELEEEMQILASWQEKKEKKSTGKIEAETSGKRSRPPVVKPPSKKCKDNNSRAHPVTTVGRPKSKNQSRVQDYDYADSPDGTKVQKNDTPNQFWASMEPYYADITSENIKYLEDWIKPLDDDSEYFKIPHLGKHYAYKWGIKDIQEEQKEGSKANEKRKGLSNNTSMNSVDADKCLKRNERDHESNDTPCRYGALTQRLMSCLIEENIMSPIDDSNDNDSHDGNSSHVANKNFTKSFNIGNPVDLEKRIRKELHEAGILDEDDSETENPEDELLSELKHVQASLKAVNEYNVAQKRKLLKYAKEEVARQEIRKKLQAVDMEVMTLFRELTNAKQNKKSRTKKERDHGMKILKERDTLMKQLNNFPKLFY